MIELYTAATTNGQRASIILEECAIPYQAHKVDLQQGEQHSAAFLALNPRGQVPVLVDPQGPGGKPLTIAQSGAIVLHCAMTSGKFLPTDPARRPLVLQAFMAAMSDCSPWSGALFVTEERVPDRSAKNADFIRNTLLLHFKEADRLLGLSDYLAGEVSIADFALYPTYNFRAPLLHEGGKLPNLKRWAAAMAARPALQRGMKIPV